MNDHQEGLWFIDKSQVVGAIEPRRRYPQLVLRIRDIQLEECEKHGITLNEMLSARRGRRVAYPRMIAMARCVDETTYSLPRIGAAFNRDHTTVMHAHKKFGAKANGQT